MLTEKTKRRNIAILCVSAVLIVFCLAACGGSDFYDTASEQLKSAAQEKDSGKVFDIVSDVFANAVESGNNQVDISSLNTDKISTRMQRNIFTGFKQTGILPYVDVKLNVKEFTLFSETAEASVSVSFLLDGQSYEKDSVVTFEKNGSAWAVSQFEYTA